jgi:tryptophan-rich sensory protein
MARSLSQILIFFWLSAMMSWLTGVGTSVSGSGGGVNLLEGLLWISSVIGSGHAFTQYIAYWGGPLRIQTQFHEQESTERTMLQQVFVQPFHIIQFMQDPAKWINLLSLPSQSKPQQTAFDPNPLIFPITWGPIRILQMVALANILHTTSTATVRKELMRHFLIQLALGDEWCRVLLEEKRIGLGIATVLCYLCSLLLFLKLSFSVNIAKSYWLLPSLVACFVSGWMNIVIFWNRIEGKQKDAIEAKMKNALVKALTLKPPVY